MITMKKSLLTTIVFMGLVSSVILADDTIQKEGALQFEVSQQKRRWTTAPIGGEEVIRPTYMAVFYLKSSSPYITVPDCVSFARSLEGVVSAEQSKFLAPWHGRPGYFITCGWSDTRYEVGVYGVSEEDVRIMSKSLIKWLDEQAEAELEKTRSALKDNRQKKSEIEDLIDNHQKEKKEIEAKFSHLKKSVPYQRIEGARDSLQEFDKVLQLTEIEIVGIQAKLIMIKEQDDKIRKESGSHPKGVFDLLFQMRLTQEIELAGALARKNAAQEAHKKALDFSNLAEQAETVRKKLVLDKEQLEKIQNRISDVENKLANPPASMRPVEVVDNKVVIYPIEVQ
ncbi:MAG TPA: hypothetical protein VMX13_02475 [Sedimentisphaerales bacterium]|nr:hypothetical protein [Sedimentisphaerales bacterium]